MTPPRPEDADAAKRAREAVAARIVRAQRVEARGLPACRVCGGATGDVDDHSLACDCAQRAAATQAKAARLAHERRREIGDDNTDRIAP